MISNDHRNAIWRQMDGMVDEEVWFNTIMTIRGRAGNPPVNSHLWETFLTGYGVKQSIGDSPPNRRNEAREAHCFLGQHR